MEEQLLDVRMDLNDGLLMFCQVIQTTLKLCQVTEMTLKLCQVTKTTLKLCQVTQTTLIYKFLISTMDPMFFSCRMRNILAKND